MKKLPILIVIITLIILLQFVYEVNTQEGVPPAEDPSGDPSQFPAPAIPPPTKINTLVTAIPPISTQFPAPAIPPPTKINTLVTAIPPISTGKLLPSARPSVSRTLPINPSEGLISTGKLSPSARPSVSRTLPINPSEEDVNFTTFIIAASIIGGTVSNLILIFIVGLCYFLLRMYKDKKENSKAIATPGLNNNENELYDEPIPTELIISNHGQEFIPNSPNYNNNQQGITRELGNNLTNNEIIQNIRQGNLSSFNIDEDIIDQMKQDILQDIKQELKQNIKSKIMTSFVRDND
ncbi:20576_t:CDS:2 [Rhizophagus irregularis]|nr:20576_t:CDS:2 [Rhizophagus irregularis]